MQISSGGGCKPHWLPVLYILIPAAPSFPTTSVLAGLNHMKAAMLIGRGQIIHNT